MCYSLNRRPPNYSLWARSCVHGKPSPSWAAWIIQSSIHSILQPAGWQGGSRHLHLCLGIPEGCAAGRQAWTQMPRVSLQANWLQNEVDVRWNDLCHLRQERLFLHMAVQFGHCCSKWKQTSELDGWINWSLLHQLEQGAHYLFVHLFCVLIS